jgi:hypothetical protein
LVHAPDVGLSLEIWWNGAVRGRPKRQRRQVAALMVYTAWNVWKERNRGIFHGVFSLLARVFTLIKEEVQLRVWALRASVVLPPV